MTLNFVSIDNDVFYPSIVEDGTILTEIRDFDIYYTHNQPLLF